MRWFFSTLSDSRGLTLVELLVVMVLALLGMLVATTAMKSYRRQAEVRGGVLRSEESLKVAVEVMRKAVLNAGYGVDRKMALYIEDAGDGNCCDRLFVNFWDFLDDRELLNDVWGYTEMTGTTPCTSCSVKELDIDNCTICDDDCYKTNCLEFKRGMYAITDVPQVAKITGVDTDTGVLRLDPAVSGEKIAPATLYFVGDSDACGGSALKINSRRTSGGQPMTCGIVDMQIAYQDENGVWYCAGNGTPCPMNPFDPTRIRLVRLTLVIRSSSKVKGGGGVVKAENGPLWGGDGYNYRAYTVEVAPRNVVLER